MRFFLGETRCAHLITTKLTKNIFKRQAFLPEIILMLIIQVMLYN